MVIFYIILMFISLPAYSYVVEVVELERNGQTVIVLGDIHNFKSISDVQEQTEYLNTFLSRLNASNHNARLLYEGIHSYTVDYSDLKVLSSNVTSDGLDMEMKTSLVAHEFLEHGADGLSYKTYTSQSILDIHLDSSDISPLTLFEPKLENYKYITKRSFDSRLAASHPDLFKFGEQKRLIAGCPYACAHYFHVHASHQMSLSDRNILKPMIDASMNSDENRRFRRELFRAQSPSEIKGVAQHYLFSRSDIVHAIDLDAIADILSHSNNDVIVLYAGAYHTEFIVDKLANDFNFIEKHRLGKKLREIEDGCFEKLADNRTRLKDKNQSLLNLGEINRYLNETTFDSSSSLISRVKRSKAVSGVCNWVRGIGNCVVDAVLDYAHDVVTTCPTYFPNGKNPDVRDWPASATYACDAAAMGSAQCGLLPPGVPNYALR